MQNRFFRKEALEHLNTPGQLDTLMTVTTPRGWLALAALGCLLAAALGWGTLGSLSVRVAGQGIILKPGGVIQVGSLNGGQVGQIRVAAGDLVKQGDVLLNVSEASLTGAMPAAAELQNSGEKTGRTAQVVSPESGRVLDVLVRKGDLISSETPVVILEPGSGGDNLEALIFVPDEEGNKIRPGMAARISPGVFKKEEFGYIQGTVKSVAGYPSTFESVARDVGSKELAQKLMGSGASIAVRVSLETDPAAPSGYRWTNGRGPDLRLNSGILCQGFITVRQVRPLSMLFPAL